MLLRVCLTEMYRLIVACLCVMVGNVETEMYWLMVACLCVMVGNAETERPFSCQRRIKTKQRCNLTVEHLDQLMRVSCSGFGVEDFDYDSALAQFAKANRRIAL